MCKKIIKNLSILLSLIMITTSMPVYANEYVDSTGSVVQDVNTEPVTGIDDNQNGKTEYTTIETNSTNDTMVYVTQSSEFSATIPKVIILNGNKDSDKSGLYEVKVSGDLASDEHIYIVPEETFVMSQAGKTDITATVEQDKVDWKWNELETTGIGKITASDMTAGLWNGKFYFNISKGRVLGDDNIPQTEIPEGYDINLSSWNYTLDEENKIITLNKYINTIATKVFISATYVINNTRYMTKLSDDCTCMFEGKLLLESIIFDKNIETSNVTTMYLMFANCRSLSNLDISCFNTSNVTDMCNMFANNYKLTNLNLSNFNTNKVRRTSGMFTNCISLTSLDLSNFDTHNIVDMTLMFNNCVTIEYILVGEDWSTSQAITDRMFNNCSVSNVTYK